jgi:hypothetical protein
MMEPASVPDLWSAEASGGEDEEYEGGVEAARSAGKK